MRVVFPAPGGATRTAAVCAAMAARKSCKTASIGSGVANLMPASFQGSSGFRKHNLARRRIAASAPGSEGRSPQLGEDAIEVGEVAFFKVGRKMPGDAARINGPYALLQTPT